MAIFGVKYGVELTTGLLGSIQVWLFFLRVNCYEVTRILCSQQGLIQAVLLMPVFERRLGFLKLDFVKKNHKIVLQ